MSVAEWDNEYARWARTASQMRTTGIRSTTTNSAADLQSGLQQLEASLNHLPLQPQEIQRRRRLIQHLAAQQQQSPPQQQQQQQSLMAQALSQQDAMIDQLAVGVGRLKTQSVAIGEEADAHIHLLDQMDTGLDMAHAQLADETRRAASLREEGSLWRLQLIVAGLFILLVLEIFMGLTP